MDLLIVDDEANVRRALRALLESEGYAVREADSAEAALLEVRASAPEAVLLDLALPGMNGLEALPHLLEAAPGVPVVMMSGHASLSDAVQATRLGAFHFIEKPLTPEAVLLTLRGAVEDQFWFITETGMVRSVEVNADAQRPAFMTLPMPGVAAPVMGAALTMEPMVNRSNEPEGVTLAHVTF